MCAWNVAKPAGTDRIRDSDDTIRANFAAIETVLGTNITAGPTSIQDAIRGDTTKGRKFRAIDLTIDNGTNDATLKCTVNSVFNGNTIAETDNIAKNATTGDFSLNNLGTILTIEASGLTGNCVCAIGVIRRNNSTTPADAGVTVTSNDIRIIASNAATGDALDLTDLVDTGALYWYILYITSA